MQGNLQMSNNRITNLPDPQLNDEAARKHYVTISMNHLPSLFFKTDKENQKCWVIFK